MRLVAIFCTKRKDAKTERRKVFIRHMSDFLSKDKYEIIGKTILDCAFEVHKELGPGLLESIYEECLCEELISKGLKVESQVLLPVFYKGKKLEKSFRIDILVEKINSNRIKICL